MSNKHRNLLVAGVLIVFGIIGFVLVYNSNNTGTNPTGPTEITVTGTLQCLPAKENIDQVPAICLFGLQTDEDTYYAINLPDNEIVDEINSEYRVTGKLFYDQSDEVIWQYEGTIEVDTIVKIN